MPGNTYRASTSYPATLRARIAEADHLARALGRLSGKASRNDPSFLWLLGRADEVRTLVEEIAREWSAGSIDVDRACEAIGTYVSSLHVALHCRYGGYGASCCGPHLEPFEGPSVRNAPARAMRPPMESGEQTLTMATVPPTEEAAPRSRSRPTFEARASSTGAATQRKSAG